MTIRINTIRELDPDAVQQELAILTQMTQEGAPSIDVRRGLIHDTLLQLSAAFGTKNQVEQERVQQSMSIAAVQADPTLADETTVDNIASNYRVTRRSGTFAGGSVTIIVDALRDVTIPVGSIFDAQSKEFATEQVFTGRASSSNVIDGADRLLSPRGDGTYDFKISVVALATGEASRLVKGTTLVPRTTPPAFISATASEDFINGINEEDNADLIARFTTGVATKSISSRSNMTAELHTNFESVISDSIIGFGDPESVRDRHSIFPISTGNRADWYVQTQSLYRTYGSTKTATFVEATSDGYGIWQMNFDRDEYPGLYTVTVKPGGAQESLGEFEIISLTRSFDLSELDNDGFVPDIATAEEAAFSRFQTVIVQFKDSLTTSSDLSVGVSTAEYNITVQAMPLLAEIQDYMLQRGVRNVAGDLLVKAPAPVYLSLSFIVQLMPGQAEPDTSLIADDLASFVNNNGFIGQIPASALLDILHNHLDDDASVTDADMVARLYYPSGDTYWFRDSEMLRIPYQPDRQVTARTAMFFLDPANVNIVFETADVLQVL